MNDRSRLRGDLLAAGICVIVLGVVLGGLVASAHDGARPVARLVGWYMAAFVPYGGALFFVRRAMRRGARLPLRWVLFSVVVVHAIPLTGPVVFSDDIYRYIWDGRVLLDGRNPYLHSPRDEALAYLRDASWADINFPRMRTVYPPAAQLVFAGMARISPNAVFFRCVFAAMNVLLVYAVFRLARAVFVRGALSSGDAETRAVFVASAYGLNPLGAVECGMSGHLDSLALVLAVFGVSMLLERRNLQGAALLGLGASVKLAPLLLVPVTGRGRRLYWLVPPLILVLGYLPFAWGNAGATVETLDSYARRWEGNSGAFAVVSAAVEEMLCLGADACQPDRRVHVAFLEEPARVSSGTFWSLHKDSRYDAAAPGTFAVRDLADGTTKLIFAVILLAVVVWRASRPGTEVTSANWIVGTLIVLTPVLHPWYLLWVLPFAAVTGVWPFYVLAALTPLAYLPLDGWWEQSEWIAPGWIVAVEWGGFAVSLVLYWASKRAGVRRGAGPTVNS